MVTVCVCLPTYVCVSIYNCAHVYVYTLIKACLHIYIYTQALWVCAIHLLYPHMFGLYNGHALFDPLCVFTVYTGLTMKFDSG